MPKDITKDPVMLEIVAGRSVEEQVEHIRKEGNHGGAQPLRKRLLGGLGIYREREKAENLILFGCYLPFRMPLSLRSYLRLLDRLGLEYTFLDKEYCCGLPMVEMSQGAERERGEAAAREFIELNLSLGREQGAKRAVYFCIWCAYLGKRFFPHGDIVQMYYPDLLLERLEQVKLTLEPTVIGYYEGCHRRNRTWAEGVELNWAGYRKLLDRVQGLKVVDLPHRVCCVDYPDRIVEEALKLNLGTVVCSCPACHARVGAAGRGKIQMSYLPDLLLQAVDR